MRDDHMRLGETANEQPADQPRPLEGIRVLAAEQMAALPFATQLLSRLGAEVVKVEHPKGGDSGRGSMPAITDPDGRKVGATFLRNNFNKRSVTLDLKSPEGVQIFLDLSRRFDVVCENFKAGGADRLGIGYDAVAAAHPGVIYLSVSGFGNDPASPYIHRAAYASIVEGMSGIYEYKRRPGKPPAANPVGALGDISSALFGVIGVLAALRQRDLTGLGQRIDIAMLDATMAMTDIVANFFSMGIPDEVSSGIGIVETFAAGNGHFVLQVVREHHFEKLAELTGNPEWVDDERFAKRAGWMANFETVIRPGVETWAADKSAREAVAFLAGEGIAAGESNSSAEIVDDDHVVARNQLVAMDRPDPSEGPPVLAPGNPIRMTRLGIGPETRVPWLGEHTDEVLAAELGFDEEHLGRLRDSGVTA
jgi:crotonobetainyl-CoA:carnitine CoA-transferase CaiB-like acyl-CoA transferase